MKPGDALAALDAQVLQRSARRVSLADDALPAVLDSARLVRENEALLRLFWDCRCALVERERQFAAPPEPTMMKAQGGMFQVLLALAGVPALLERHAALKVSREITDATLADLPLWMRHYREKHGRWGLAHIHWLRNHILGDLFRIGRLQYMSRQWNTGVLVYRHAHNNEVCAFVAPGAAYRADGYPDGVNGVRDAQPWQSLLNVEAETVTGNPITPDGRAVRVPVTLPLRDWRVVLRDGDDVLDVHIPAEQPLEPEACRQSFANGLTFFGMLFPEKKYRAFMCCSWLLDGQLAALLPPEANIVQFQRMFRLHPSNHGEHQTYERVFAMEPAATETLPATTRLQQACLRHIKAGGRFYEGGGFILVEDVTSGECGMRSAE